MDPHRHRAAADAALRSTDLDLARLRGEINIAAPQRRNAWAGSAAADIIHAA